MTLRVLVLCAGNIGRSPLAAALLRRALARELDVPLRELEPRGLVVVSAGTEAPIGHPASRRGMAFAAAHGIDLSDHEAALLTAPLAEAADVIYGFDRAQVDAVRSVSPSAASRVRLWGGKGSEIPDPHHESDEFFVAVAERISAAVPDRAEEILARFGEHNRQ